MAVSRLHYDFSNELFDHFLLGLGNWLSPCLRGSSLLEVSWLDLLRGRFSNDYLSSRSFNFDGSIISQFIKSQKTFSRGFSVKDGVRAVLWVLEP